MPSPPLHPLLCKRHYSDPICCNEGVASPMEQPPPGVAETIWMSLLWSSSTWNTTKAQRAQLASWSARLVSRVVRTRRPATMDNNTWWRLMHRTGHTLIASHKIGVVELAMQRVMSWAGHVARLPQTAPAAVALRCRSLQWWRWRQEQHRNSRQSAVARGIHPRRFRILPLGRSNL